MRSRRAVSPAASENEVDILDSLYTDDGGRIDAQDGMAFDAEDIFGGAARGGQNYDDDDGDEAFIALTQAASFRKTGNLKGKSAKKGGGFQSMGLNANLLRAITRKGFSVPTPIQRKAIPLIMDRKDLVGMARTGSGKTAAFVIPMIERLRAHSATIGARGLILSPSRELAIQTLKVVKEFSKGTDLKCVLLVGGDSLEEQFGSMTSNPDIVIATPGRFLHLKVEMGLSLSSIQYVVFDEADRLFEMGFAAQLTEILHALPPSRQSLLFSATLPASLVEFARAGLQDPSLVRLDAETKVSPDLESAFFSVKSAEKEGALLHVLNDLIKMPLGLPNGVQADSDRFNKKRKRVPDKSRGREKPTEHSTIVFAATKHHVDYLATLLKEAGFAVSYVYGSLDQTARMEQVENFRKGRSNILVVTDVAARGIDIPILANVINYDFPPQPKVFVHRVGRTARAGQRGWSYSIVRDTDVPYLIDLQLFLGKKLVLGRESDEVNYAEDVVVGAPMRSKVEANVEWQTKLLGDNEDIANLKRVSEKAEKLYLRTRNSASSQSAKRARDVVASKGWTQLHPVFGGETGDLEQRRAEMLAQLSGYRPTETIFESKMMNGKGLKNDAAEIMATMRKKIKLKPLDKLNGADADEMDEDSEVGDDDEPFGDEDEVDDEDEEEVVIDGDSDDDDGLEVTVTNNETASKKSKKKNQTPASYQDSEVFMTYEPRTFNANEERGYGVHSGGNTSSFVESARDATMDLNNDEGGKSFGVPTRSKMRWDQKSRKYVARENDEDGSKGSRMVRGESGVKIAASFQSGRFDRWKKAQRIGKMPRVGDFEKNNGGAPSPFASSGPRYKHKMEKAPKEADKFRDDYHERKKRVDEAKEKRIGRFKEGVGINRNEMKSTEDVRKSRKLAERRRAKNARPTHRK
ncbi:ATP-dependent RNA helicase DBP10 [Apiospora arundinis]|uniref:RNA helicase n=1 Tax=Apiospora arundinis TaxID=335852 RepID=A0ABR2IVH1_9PEZI